MKNAALLLPTGAPTTATIEPNTDLAEMTQKIARDGCTDLGYEQWFDLFRPRSAQDGSLMQFEAGDSLHLVQIEYADRANCLWTVVEVDAEEQADSELNDDLDEDGDLPIKRQVIVNGYAFTSRLFYVICEAPCYFASQVVLVDY